MNEQEGILDHDCDLLENAPECVRRGHRRLQLGIYRCIDGHDHIIIAEICRAYGVPDTPENCEMLAAAAVEMLKKYGHETKVVP